jgi:hypothetical protein
MMTYFRLSARDRRSSMEKIEVGFHEVNPTYKIGDRTMPTEKRSHWPNKLYC